MPDYLKLSIDFQAPVYKRHAAAAMNWLCYFVILLAVILAVDRSKAAVLLEQRQKPLLFVHQASCTYDYEVAVHTARGAQSTAGEGFQLHALVSSQLSNRVKLNYVLKDQHIFLYLKACIFLRKNSWMFYSFLSTARYLCDTPKKSIDKNLIPLAVPKRAAKDVVHKRSRNP